MIKNCLQCNKEFKTIPAKIKRGLGKYCSTDCYIESQRTNKLGKNNPNWRGGVRKCLICNGNRSVFDYPNRGGKYCKDCYLNILKEGGETASNWRGGISRGDNRSSYYTKKKQERRARKYNARGSHTTQEWEDLKKKYGYMCLCCKRFEPSIKLTEDHIVPLVRGGSDNIKNIQPLCANCNSQKWTNVVDYRVELIVDKTFVEK